jgi:hypothetical protein
VSGKTRFRRHSTAGLWSYAQAENQDFSARLSRDGGKEDASRWVSVARRDNCASHYWPQAIDRGRAATVEAALRALAQTAGETVTLMRMRRPPIGSSG